MCNFKQMREIRFAGTPQLIVMPLRGNLISPADNPRILGRTVLLQLFEKFSYAQPRFGVASLGAFAGIGLMLVVIGVFSVMAYTVSLQTHEIGIRMALGASPAMVRQLILVETMHLAGIGTAIGIVGALIATRLAASLLYGVTATDPATFGGMIVVLAAVAALAGYLPAVRAAKIEPVMLLRSE